MCLVDIMYNTYHINNLKYSLKALQQLNYEFNLIIHNDNPNIILTQQWLTEHCELNKIKYNNLTIINESVNVGMLFSRINSFRSIDQHSEYTMFMDDDDYLLITDLPEFEDFSWYRYNMVNLYKMEDFEEVFSKQENGYISFNIGASFWKSSLIDLTFKYLEENRLDFKINGLEDYTIQQISDAFCLKLNQKYLKQYNIPGQIYNRSVENKSKYSHILEPRYSNIESNYEQIIAKYCSDLRIKILNEI